MKTEENKRMLALACTVADLKTENMNLAQREQELVDEYNNVAHQLNEKKWSNEEAPSKQTLDELQQMREQCEKLERENKELRRFAKAMHTFVIDKNLNMIKGTSCKYRQGKVAVSSTACLKCSSCLDVIGVNGVNGVICEKRLAEACAVFPSHD